MTATTPPVVHLERDAPQDLLRAYADSDVLDPKNGHVA